MATAGVGIDVDASRESEAERSPSGRRLSKRLPEDCSELSDTSQGMPKTASQMELELTAGWSPARVWVHRWVDSDKGNVAFGCVIVLNVISMIVEADIIAGCYPDECSVPTITWINRTFLAIYTVEAAMRLFVWRGRYLHDMWNILDVCIVVCGWLDGLVVLLSQGGSSPAGVQMLPLLRVLRVARLVRTLRLLRLFPVLYIMIKGFVGAMKAMLWGLLLIVVLLVIWAMIIVELVHPISKDAQAALLQNDPDANPEKYCVDMFSSIFGMTLLLFQSLVAGDSWGSCMLPIVKIQPWTFIPFALALTSVSLGFMNLILAAIVDNSMTARELEREEKVVQKRIDEQNAIKQWMGMAKRLDKNQNGVISLDEMMDAFDDDEAVRETLDIMGIEKEDFMQIFHLVDLDESGDLSYDEFIDSFLKAHQMEDRVYMMMTKLQTDGVAKAVKRIGQRLEQGRPGKRALQCAPEAPLEASLAPLGAKSLSFDADFQCINERIQEQFAALADALSASVEVSAHVPPSSDATSLDDHLQRAERRIQEQFNSLARSLEANTCALVRETGALKAAACAPEQAAAASSAKPTARSGGGGDSAPRANDGAQSRPGKLGEVGRAGESDEVEPLESIMGL